jgi:hypothetical protein
VLPLTNEPPQPVTEAILYPAFGVTVNVRVVPDTTPVIDPDGLIVPPVPALAVMV